MTPNLEQQMRLQPRIAAGRRSFNKAALTAQGPAPDDALSAGLAGLFDTTGNTAAHFGIGADADGPIAAAPGNPAPGFAPAQQFAMAQRMKQFGIPGMNGPQRL